MMVSTDPVRSKTRRRLAALFSVPLAFSLLFFAVTIASEHTDIGLLRIQNLSACTGQLRAVATDIESGERGFLLTGDEHFLNPYQTARASLPGQVATCLRDAQDQSPELQKQVRKAGTAVQRRSEIASRTVATALSQGRAAAVNIVNDGEGEQLMNSARLSISQLETMLNGRETEFLREQQRLNRAAFLFFMVGIIVLIAVLYRLYHASISYLHDRDLADLRLEEQVEERTRDLRMANEELQQFAYVASHDLQEPLRTITSFSQLIEERYKGRLDADADEFLGYIVTSARRMTDLINGLLALVRLRKTGQPVDPVPFADILADAEASLRTSLEENSAQITCESLPELVVNRAQFSQVVQNLVSNALKYRSDRTPSIHVAARRDATHWIFSIRDNGRGFDSQFAERIFGLFQRLNNREAIEGTGMGLSIARKIVERHGGRMWAESTEGQGATFFFSLPVTLEGGRQTIIN